MTLFDFILLVVLFGFIWAGFWAGFIKTAGSLVGAFVAIFVAGAWYERAGDWVKPFVGGNDVAAKIVGFVLVFIIVSQLVGVLFLILNKAFNFIAIVPGLKFINRLGGAIIGFVEGTLVIGITMQFVSRLPLSPDWADKLNNSGVVAYFISLSSWLVPLFPKALEQIKSVIK